MKVFVAGATGRVARELIADLVAAGHDVIAAARRPENVTAALTAEEKAHVRPLAFDLHGTQAHLESALVDAKAVYFVAGSRGKDLLQTDAFGAVKLMRAAQGYGRQALHHAQLGPLARARGVGKESRHPASPQLHHRKVLR